ncbi:reverse transcriptase domain-containing protein [Tanacetum coccineum]
MLKVSPQKCVILFGKRKINPRYIGPFKILERIGPVAYKLELPEELSNVHSTFHISNIKKCLSNESLVIPMKEIQLDNKLNFVEEPVEIMDREVKQLKQSRIPIIKVTIQIRKEGFWWCSTAAAVEDDVWWRWYDCDMAAKMVACRKEVVMKVLKSCLGALDLGSQVEFHRRVPFDQRNNPPQHPRIVYPSILNINHFCHFLDILRNYDPIDDEPMWAADRVVAPTLGFAITIPETANEFAIKSNHLTRVKGNQFDGKTKTDPHKHIHEFLGIYDMFKYRDTENEVVRLMMFPLSLIGEAKTWLDEPLSLTGEAKTWLDELNEGTIETWDELQTAFISRFFPPPIFD